MPRDTRGGSLLEYLIITGVVALMAIGAWRVFHQSVEAKLAKEAHAVATLEWEGTGESADTTHPSGGPGPQAGQGPPGSGPQAGEGQPGSGQLAAAEDLPGSGFTPETPSRIIAPAQPRSDDGTERAGGPAGSSSPAATAAKFTADVLKVMCPKDKAFLQDLQKRGVSITVYDRIYFEDPYFDGTKWTTKHFEAGGMTSGTDIDMIRGGTPEDNAATVYHEGVHTGQASSMAWREKEYDAYRKEDEWRISHGLPPHDSTFRTRDKSGKEVTNEAAIRKFVDKNYPGVTAKSPSGGSPEQIVGVSSSGKTIVKRSDGTKYERAPQKGDSYPAAAATTVPPGGIPIDMSKLQCP